jgi:hypothetical protein
VSQSASDITIKETTCFLGRALSLKSKAIELLVTLDVGPRIISLSKVNGENIFFNDVNQLITKDVQDYYGKGKQWQIYGGHRIWLAPENELTYYPDNGVVNYEIVNYSVVFSPPKRLDSFEIKLSVCFLEDNKVEIISRARNLASSTRKIALWNLTVLKPGGVETLDLDTEDNGYLPNRNLVFWSYSDIKDPRIDIENNKITLKSSKDISAPFKIGLFKKDISVTYELGNTKFSKYVKSEIDDYPDFGCNFESYISDNIHEIESLSPLRNLKKGEHLVHKEIWEIL